MKHILCLIFLIIAFKNTISQVELPQRISSADAELIAKEFNTVFKKGQNKVTSAEGKYLSGISPQMPELSLTYDFVPVGTGLGNYEERSIELNQSFEFPLKTVYKGEWLNGEIDIIVAENELDALNVLTEVRKAYIILLEKQSLIKIAEENSSVAEEFKTKSAVRFNLGEATNLEKLTADVQYAQAINNLEVLKNQYNIALHDLLTCIGIPHDNKSYNPVLTDSLKFKPFHESIESLLQKTAVSNPLLNLFGLKKSNSLINKKIAVSSYLPDFKVGYKSQSINGVNDFYGVNFGISVPLWFMFDQRGKVKEADAEIKINENEFDAVSLNVYSSVKKAYLNFKNSENQILLYMNTLSPEADEIFRVADAGFRIGDISYLEFLQAKQTMISIKEGYVSALKDYNLNLIELEKSIGSKLF
ncbi:MAG: TolC family protein [Candidatus Kapaibacterium sp.]